MNIKLLQLFGLLLVFFSCKEKCMEHSVEQKIKGSIIQKSKEFNEPVAAQIPKQLTLHGDTRTDDYYWLNERENPAVRAYLQEENDYLENVLEPVKELRSDFYDEMLARIKQDDNTVPYARNGYSYYIRYESGKEYPIYCRKYLNETNAVEQIILDVNTLAEGKKFCNVIAPKISPDNQLAIYGMDTSGRNLHEAFIKNLNTNEIIESSGFVIAGGFVWTPDSKAVFYDTKDEQTLRTDKVWLHVLGSSFDKDSLVYHEQDETAYVSISSSKDEQFLFIHSGYTEVLECSFIQMNNYQAKPTLIKKREKDFFYSVEHFMGSFLILTNDRAKNFKIVKTSTDKYQYEYWKEFIPHNEKILLQDILVFNKWLILFERKDGLNQFHILPWNNLESGHYIKFPDPSYYCWLGPNYEMDTDTLRLAYTSLTTPVSTFEYQMQTRELQLLKENQVLGGFKKENYISEYIHIKSRDGIEIPVSIVYRKGFKKEGTAPAVLYGYGSYGISMDVGFSSNILSLLDRGFVYVIAHVRGGKENGWQWYEDGKMLKKLNTFNDFIDCAEYLITHKYTSANHLFAKGGSAGGLLMGVIYNMRPDLFKGIISNVPFVDVLTTMSDPSIPLTTGEYNEWGNPEIKEEYDYMKMYSPIDNISAKKYTNLLVTTGFSDSQVQYWEPAKWVAKLRKKRSDKKDLILFYTNLDAGHGGASGRFERLREIALEYAFMFGLLASEKK